MSATLSAPTTNTTSIANTSIAPATWLLSDLPIQTTTLLFGLNFRATEVTKAGLISRIKGSKQLIDIDLSCLLYDRNCQLIDQVWFKQLRDSTEAVRHQGDSLDGKDRGAMAELDHNIDLEQIELRLPKLSPQTHHLALVVSSYHGQPLRLVDSGTIRITDDENNIVDLQDLTALPQKCHALWYAGFTRELGEWRVTMHKLPLNTQGTPNNAEEIKAELLRTFVPR